MLRAPPSTPLLLFAACIVLLFVIQTRQLGIWVCVSKTLQVNIVAACSGTGTYDLETGLCSLQSCACVFQVLFVKLEVEPKKQIRDTYPSTIFLCHLANDGFIVLNRVKKSEQFQQSNKIDCTTGCDENAGKWTSHAFILVFIHTLEMY